MHIKVLLRENAARTTQAISFRCGVLGDNENYAGKSH